MLESEPRKLHPVLMLFLVFVTIFASFVIIGPLIGFVVSLPFYDGDVLDLMEKLQDPLNHPEVKTPLFIMQGFATFIGLIVGPLLLCMVVREPVRKLFISPLYLVPLAITPAVVIIFSGVNSVFIEWNASLHLPEAMRGFEEWARAREDQAAELTKMMIEMNGVGELLVSLVVIALLPAVGEELVFRGLIQGKLYEATKNSHVSIWIAAVLFSAIHMQFFGFVPRLLLGALFGYLYYWSGSLTLAMLAHFVNNGFAVVGYYLYQQGEIEYNVEGTEALPLSMVLSSALLSFGLLYYFRRFYQEKANSTDH